MQKKLDVSLEDIFEEDTKTVIYKNKEGNNNFNFGTINVNIPDFVLNYINILQVQTEKLQAEIQLLKEENASLKNQK